MEPRGKLTVTALAGMLGVSRVIDLEHSRRFGDPVYPPHRPGTLFTRQTPAGFAQLGIDTVPPIIARGVLLDVSSRRRHDLEGRTVA